MTRSVNPSIIESTTATQTTVPLDELLELLSSLVIGSMTATGVCQGLGQAATVLESRLETAAAREMTYADSWRTYLMMS